MPDWKKPKIQVINDSVSYVFYKLIGQIGIDGKRQAAKEINGSLYLMVKNEKEFYKAFYYSNELDPVNVEKDNKEFDLELFTGKLLLSNLRNGPNYLLDYENGHLSESYKKKGTLAIKNKLQSVKGSTSYWETQCHTEIRWCTFSNLSYSSCTGGFVIIYSPTCHWPPNDWCGTYSLTDYDEATVCVDTWFPDPPIEPGGGGDGGSTPVYGRITNHITNPCLVEGVKTAESANTGIKNMLNLIFGGTDDTNFDLNFYESMFLGNTIDGTMFQSNDFNFDITLNSTTLPQRSKEYVLATVYHEILHAYLSVKYPKDLNGQLLVPDEHNTMASSYLSLLTEALMEAYPNIDTEHAWALSWGGLHETPFYGLLSAQQKALIVSINDKHRKSATNRLGTYCD